MMETQQTSPAASSSSSNNNGRMIFAIAITLFAFLVEIYNDNPRLLNLNTLMTKEVLPSSASFSAIFIVVPVIISFITLYIIAHLHQKSQQSSIIGLPSPPNASFLFGHYIQLVYPSTHSKLFTSHATPSGITSLWGPNLKVCATLLKAHHVRTILRHTPSRDFSSFIVKHGKRTLGTNSLILIGGGREWRSTRNMVQKAFTMGAITSGRGAVGECAMDMVRWLLQSLLQTNNNNNNSNSSGEKCNGHKCIKDKETGKERNVIHLDVESFFKLFSLDVFGRVTMDYDFECLQKATSSSSNTNTQQLNNHSNRTTNCTCFTSPPEASAFEYLERDIGVRAHPKHLLNPFVQLYWLPTRHNREYHRNLSMVNTLMGDVIGLKLDEFLGRLEVQREQQQQSEKDGEEENMMTMMLRSVIEEQYSHLSKNEHQLNSTTASSNDTSSSSCPFSSSTSIKEPNNNIMDNIPTTNMTQSDRSQIISNVTSILHTLLVAGYETTAVSLSYTMYCLSKHPRCQERACEEARRVLSTLDNNTKFDEDALPYCKAIALESLRIHTPVIFTTRVSARDITLDTDDEGGMVTIPKNTRFILNPTMIHTDERNFDRATEFIPERWVKWNDEDGRWVDRDLEEEKLGATTPPTTRQPPPSLSEKYTSENAQADTISAANPQNFFAFSDGARNCIGRRLAIMESTIFIAVLLRDMCVGLADEDYELVKERRFVILAPKELSITFWKRDD